MSRDARARAGAIVDPTGAVPNAIVALDAALLLSTGVGGRNGPLPGDVARDACNKVLRLVQQMAWRQPVVEITQPLLQLVRQELYDNFTEEVGIGPDGNAFILPDVVWVSPVVNDPPSRRWLPLRSVFNSKATADPKEEEK